MRGRAPLPRVVRRLTAVVAAVATLTLGVLGGLSYLWCAPMGEARLHCCCPHDEHATEPALRVDCCEARVVAELPEGTSSGDPAPAVAPAPLDATWLATVLDSVPRPAPAIFLPLERARAGPPRPLYRQYSVYLL